MPPSLRTCRNCGAPTRPAGPHYPFCGVECRERDLENWASESYRVAAAPDDDELPAFPELPARPDEE